MSAEQAAADSVVAQFIVDTAGVPIAGTLRMLRSPSDAVTAQVQAAYAGVALPPGPAGRPAGPAARTDGRGVGRPTCGSTGLIARVTERGVAAAGCAGPGQRGRGAPRPPPAAGTDNAQLNSGVRRHPCDGCASRRVSLGAPAGIAGQRLFTRGTRCRNHFIPGSGRSLSCSLRSRVASRRGTLGARPVSSRPWSSRSATRAPARRWRSGRSGSSATVRSWTRCVRTRVPASTRPACTRAGAADERRGTYAVEVRAPGYTTWTHAGVRVGRDQCHVRTQRVHAALTAAG
jgi:hypothetical protein